MSTLKVNLSDDLSTFVNEQAAAYGYPSAGEYLSAMIAKQRDVEQLRNKLMDGPKSGPPKEVDNSWFLALREHAIR